jgi:glutamate racemase
MDSGLGGLTVARAIRSRLPAENIVYFGDTARLPYGSKTAATVTGFVREIVGYLLPLNPKHVVVACNTATALALSAVRADFPGVSISGVIEPGALAATALTEHLPDPVFGVLATEGTVASGAYEKILMRGRPGATVVQQPAPLLVPIIEEGRDGSDPIVKLALRQYLMPLLARRPDVIVLGCTHYPILRDEIERIAGPDVAIVDAAGPCAEDIAGKLGASGQLRQGGEGWIRYFVTDKVPRFARMASAFLGTDIGRPVWVAPEELHATHPSEAIDRDMSRVG